MKFKVLVEKLEEVSPKHPYVCFEFKVKALPY